MRFTLADFTANREFHPAPKTLLFSCSYQEYLLYRTSAIALEDFGNISEVYMCSEDNGIGVAVYQILVCVTLWHMNILGRDETRFLPGGDRYPDWPILLVKDACGRFCGMSMHVYNDFPEPKQQAAAWWYGKYHPDYECTVSYFWGEGREKFFVDGEKEPSTFGTGTEDYIGYAFSAEPPFSNWDGAFAAAPNLAYTCRGHISHCRFQIPDNIPFQ